ncbi:MAG TPA: hypothetical protein VJJ21_01935 [Candidatus Nanoarchaeia archaeon]|nr:hypothetical protein [Candidatus Nanoarchaeia archaeon]
MTDEYYQPIFVHYSPDEKYSFTLLKRMPNDIETSLTNLGNFFFGEFIGRRYTDAIYVLHLEEFGKSIILQRAIAKDVHGVHAQHMSDENSYTTTCEFQNPRFEKDTFFFEFLECCRRDDGTGNMLRVEVLVNVHTGQVLKKHSGKLESLCV